MNSKKAIILAAGKGTRLYPLTKNKTKCMVDVNGKTIIHNCLNNLQLKGVEEVIIVIGYNQDVLKSYLGNAYEKIKISYIVNKEYDTTNSMYSLYLALKELKGEVIILESDIYFDLNVLEFNKNKEISWFVDSSIKNVDGSYVKCNDKGLVNFHSIIRDLALIDEECKKSLGILHLSSKGNELLLKWLQQEVDKENKNIYYDLVLGKNLKSEVIEAIDVSGTKWYEIDDLKDLDIARRMFI